MMHDLKELTPNVQTCAVIAFSKKAPLGEVKRSFCVSQKERGQLTHYWRRNLWLEKEEKLAAFLPTDKDIRWVEVRICSLLSTNEA